MLWLLHELGDGQQGCELVTNFAVYKGFGNALTFGVNERPMQGTVVDGVLLMEHIKDLLRQGKTVFRHLDELPGFTMQEKTTR